MATRPAGNQTALNTSGLTSINPVAAPTFDAPSSTSDFQLGDALGGLGGDTAVSSSDAEAAATNPSEIEPSDWIKNSSLMKPDEFDKGFATCLFESLGYCEKGMLFFGFCQYHVAFMFNVNYTPEGSITYGNESLVFTKRNRKLFRYPLPFELSLMNVFPIPELFQNYEQFEKNIQLDLFAYLLQQRTDQSTTAVEIASHKMFLLRLFKLFTPNQTSQNLTGDTILMYTVRNWINYMGNELKRTSISSSLLVLVQTANGQELRALSWEKCSVLTKAIILMMETPYALCPSLNYKWVSSMCAMTVLDGKLVVDQTKALCGTTFKTELPCYGDPATLSYFRLDPYGDVVILEENYSPVAEVCFKSELDKAELLGVGGGKNRSLLAIAALSN